MFRKNLKLFLRGAISLLLLGYLTLFVNWPDILEALRELRTDLYILSTLSGLVTTLFVAAKYYLLIQNSSISRSFFSMVKINFISRFYGMFLPSAVGRIAVRWYKITRNRQGRVFFLSVTIVERLTFLATVLFFGLAFLFIISSNPEILRMRSQIWPLAVIIMFLAIAAISLFFHPKFRFLLKSFLERLLPPRLKGEELFRFLDDFAIEKRATSLLTGVLGLSVLWYFVFLWRMYFLFQALSLPLQFFDIAWMSSLVLLLQMIPISFAGLGIREGAYSYLVTIFNLPPEKGASIGILFFSQMLLLSLIGWVFEMLDNPKTACSP